MSDVPCTAEVVARYGRMALDAMFQRKRVTLTHPAGWQRPVNWPLPAVRSWPAADGSLTQDYRPLAILEYVDWALGELEKEDPLW